MSSNATATKNIDVTRAIRVNKNYGYSTETWKGIQRVVGTTADGIVGKNTVNSIASWQTKYFSGSDIDGICGSKTLAKVKQDSKFGGSTSEGGSKTETKKEESKTETGNLPSGNITEHFTWNEFKCHDGSAVPKEKRSNTIKLCKNLEKIREAAGGKSISITSGYRSPSYNSKIGGAAKSQHKEGAAADIKISGMKPSDVHALISKLCKQGKIHDGGLGKYSSFTHYDVRSGSSRWSG